MNENQINELDELDEIYNLYNIKLSRITQNFKSNEEPTLSEKESILDQFDELFQEFHY